MSDARIRLGVAGLGRAFTVMLPTLAADPRIRLVAATDPRPEARRQFEADFGGRAHDSVEGVCADPAVDAVYIATPHQLHCAHVCIAAGNRKHVLVEKPMALSIDECTRMIDAADGAGVALVVGHSHSFDLPILRARAVIDHGDLGTVRMVHAMNYTDFMYRPRRPEELRTDEGGGVIFSQGAHQIDIVRLLAGGMTMSVRAMTCNWDPLRPTEGAYSALLQFADGAHAAVTYNGYGHYDSDELMGWCGELGQARSPAEHGAARRRLCDNTAGVDEAALKAERNYGGSRYVPAPSAARSQHQHFGHIIISCERGDIVPMPEGLHIYGDFDRRFEPLAPPAVPRSEVIDELIAAIQGEPPLHSGRWSRATTEVCLAMLASARGQREIALSFQVAMHAPE